METQFIGYPHEVFYAVAIIGVVLVLYRPRWAFFFVVFGLSVRHFHMAAFTRIPSLGEYLNLNDLFLWIGVAAMVRLVWKKHNLWIPNILLAIFGIVLLGSFQSLLFYGFTREVMQDLWRAWIFPLMFLVGANVVRDNKDARLFFWALFLGSFGAALQHIFLVQTKIQFGVLGIGVSQLRTISFIMSGGIFLVVSAFFIDMRKIFHNTNLFLFWLVGLACIGISYILSFTRTWWIGAFLSGVALFIVFYRERRSRLLPRIGYAVALLAVTFLVFQLANTFLLADANLTRIIDERADFVRYEDTFEKAYQTRETGMESELELWKNGSILWGVGTSYPPALSDAPIEVAGAVGHVAYSVYLAHFGLIGFLVYGLLLPFLSIKVGKQYFLRHLNDYGGIIAITGMALAFFDLFTLLSSNHYLASTSQVQGLIYGSLWGLSRIVEVRAVVRFPRKIMLHKTSHQWLPGPVNQ